jgi:undecaprenyl-diphosphatase
VTSASAVTARAGAPGWPRRGAVGKWIRAFDDTVDRWVERSRDPRLDPLFYGLSSAADHALLWIAIGALRAARRGQPANALRFAAALGVESALTNGPIKLAFRRIRPPSAPPGPLPYGMHRPVTSAFPSGHATTAFMAATLLSDGAATSAYWELAVLVAASRVYVRMHHASDTVAGALLGLVFGQIAKPVLTASTRESRG